MSTTTTVHFEVGGDGYAELKAKAESAIYKFISESDLDDDFEEDEEETSIPKTNYELIVRKTNDVSSEFEYIAEVIARLKDVN